MRLASSQEIVRSCLTELGFVVLFSLGDLRPIAYAKVLGKNCKVLFTYRKILNRFFDVLDDELGIFFNYSVNVLS